MQITEVRALLNAMAIPYEESIIPTQNDHLHLLGFPSSRSAFPIRLLTIRNPHHEKHLCFLFRDASENSVFDELYFGGFTPDFARSTDEFLREAIPGFTENVMSGRMHIIERRDVRTGGWTGDSMFLDSPDEAENDMDEFEAALRRIRKERSWLKHLFSAGHIHEIYNWTSYEQILPFAKESPVLMKKRKILRELAAIPAGDRTAFEQLLEQYLGGDLKEILESFGMRRISFHIDWHDTYRCINIQGRIGSKYVDIQIEPDHFLLDCAEDEPDAGTEYPLISPGQFYAEAKRLTEE